MSDWSAAEVCAHIRGHAIIHGNQGWVFADTGDSVADTWSEKPCAYCGEPPTPEGHDACLGTLPGVANACCGYGNTDDAYVQFSIGWREIREHAAMRYFKRRNCGPSFVTPAPSTTESVQEPAGPTDKRGET